MEDKKIYKTGQKPGTCNCHCTNCGQELNMGTEDKLPPCPRCTNNEFTCDL